MGLRARWLKVVKPENGGPRTKNVLLALARTPRQKANAEEILKDMLGERALVMYGDKRGATYGLPRERRPRAD